jgi:hypothetical protein
VAEVRPTHSHAAAQAALSNTAHRAVGALFAIVSVLAALEALGIAGRTFLLFLAALQFLAYREPEGAFVPGETHSHHGP